jgi:hypothetical protein
MSVIVNILAAIGLIVIISYVIHYLYVYIKKNQNKIDISQINPPADYMQNTGITCPDYWVNTGVDSKGNYVCKNLFNVKVNSDSKCNSKEMSFSPIQSGYTWEYNNPNGLKSLSDDDKYTFLTKAGSTNGLTTRCDWINKCGPSPTTQGVWQGVNEICNNPKQ